MFAFDLSGRFLTPGETALFGNYLEYCRLDSGIWDVFGCLFDAAVPGTSPLMLRVYEKSQLCGAAILLQCAKYGRSMYGGKLAARAIDSLGVPFCLWIKFGCCMDMMSNPGFVVDPAKADEIQAAMAQYLRKRFLVTLIYDYSDRARLYPGSTMMPSMPHALIDTSGMTSAQDYTAKHKNLRRKMNIFRNNGGTFEVVSGVLSQDAIASVKKCFLVTAEKSVVYLPYQDIYLSSALRTSATPLQGVHYFVARLNGEFLGYQAAIKTGTCLNALHGAFDRERKTTYHAYDLLFAQMVEFAVDNGLTTIDFGSVINTTKQRAVNRVVDMSYFLFSRNAIAQRLLARLLRGTKMQGEEQLRFRTGT